MFRHLLHIDVSWELRATSLATCTHMTLAVPWVQDVSYMYYSQSHWTISVHTCTITYEFTIVTLVNPLPLKVNIETDHSWWTWLLKPQHVLPFTSWTATGTWTASCKCTFVHVHVTLHFSCTHSTCTHTCMYNNMYLYIHMYIALAQRASPSSTCLESWNYSPTLFSIGHGRVSSHGQDQGVVLRDSAPGAVHQRQCWTGHTRQTCCTPGVGWQHAHHDRPVPVVSVQVCTSMLRRREGNRGEERGGEGKGGEGSGGERERKWQMLIL